MGVGYLGLFDRIDHTSSSEWSSRQGEDITTEQIHHTAATSDALARALMAAGGRTVSSNGLLLRDGTLVEVVPGQYRAFTSASGFDRQSLTVETVNQTGSPSWGISEIQRLRLAKLNRDMAAAGLPITVGRRGIGGILGHFEVPGTYATACPGPDMHLNHIATLALIEPEPPKPPTPPNGRNVKEVDMIAFVLNDGAGKFGPVGKVHTYTIGAGFFIETTGFGSANPASVIVNGYWPDGSVIAAPNLTYAELYAYAKASHALTDDELAPFKAAAGQ